MGEATRRWGIPKHILVWARDNKCPAFHGVRVHMVIRDWLKENPPPEDLEEDGTGPLDDEIKKRRIKKLDLEIGEKEKSLVSVDSVKYTWTQAMERIMATTQAMMGKEEYNAWAKQVRATLKGMDL